MTPQQKHDLAEYLACLTADDWFWYDWEEEVITMLEKEIETAIRAKALLDEIEGAA